MSGGHPGDGSPVPEPLRGRTRWSSACCRGVLFTSMTKTIRSLFSGEHHRLIRRRASTAAPRTFSVDVPDVCQIGQPGNDTWTCARILARLGRAREPKNATIMDQRLVYPPTRAHAASPRILTDIGKQLNPPLELDPFSRTSLIYGAKFGGFVVYRIYGLRTWH